MCQLELVLKHDIDMGTSSPIRQHAYRVSPDKHARLQQQVDYMLENGNAELVRVVHHVSFLLNPMVLITFVRTSVKLMGH